MNIGTASDHSGLPMKTIRYYEEIGLIRPDRAINGYRDYCESDLHKLAFLHRARGLGFSIDECRQLLALYEDTSRASADVRELAEQKIVEIDKKMRELKQLRNALGYLVSHCHGDDRPDCPILDTLSGGRIVQ